MNKKMKWAGVFNLLSGIFGFLASGMYFYSPYAWWVFFVDEPIEYGMILLLFPMIGLTYFGWVVNATSLSLSWKLFKNSTMSEPIRKQVKEQFIVDALVIALFIPMLVLLFSAPITDWGVQESLLIPDIIGKCFALALNGKLLRKAKQN